ncbi:Glutaredoxin 4 [Candidatus Johnevansia muelleri]|uniref:Glutaredoxin n=1 Tax=Candidatus Johnevansia muelleri TaxID=1495769 RepID=A0A078KE75_9GAMM|nr:Glutaredoxin 4 [Candidatus Evansia muelleri]
MKKTLDIIKNQIRNNSVLLYMKGTPENPQCGFSAKAVQILNICCKHFSYINILENHSIRLDLPKYANWPTFPQLWINGDLIGGCDIITEMYNNGTLKRLLKNK